MYTYNSGVQGHPQLHSKFKASLGYRLSENTHTGLVGGAEKTIEIHKAAGLHWPEQLRDCDFTARWTITHKPDTIGTGSGAESRQAHNLLPGA